MYRVSDYGKTMLEVSKELGVSKDVVKYHQRKMNSNESFKAGGKIYITPAGEEKIKNGLRKDKEFYSVTFESKLMNQIHELNSNQWHHEFELKDLAKKIDRIDKKLDQLVRAPGGSQSSQGVLNYKSLSKTIFFSTN